MHARRADQSLASNSATVERDRQVELSAGDQQIAASAAGCKRALDDGRECASFALDGSFAGENVRQGACLDAGWVGRPRASVPTVRNLPTTNSSSAPAPSGEQRRDHSDLVPSEGSCRAPHAVRLIVPANSQCVSVSCDAHAIRPQADNRLYGCSPCDLVLQLSVSGATLSRSRLAVGWSNFGCR